MIYFEKSVNFVLQHEGGYANVSNDRGGETNYGISQAFLNSIGSNLKVKDVTRSKAIELYYEYFWFPLNLGRIADQTVATFVLDSAVNHGNSRAGKILQKAINLQKSVTIDGIIGEQTIKACNEIVICEKNKVFLIDSLKSIRKNFYAQIVENYPGQRCFIRGWFNRVNDFFCLGFVNDD